MKKQKQKSSPESRILLGYITNEKLLAATESLYRRDYFKTKGGRTLADWCVDHFRKYNDAPGADIAAVFNTAKRKHKIDEGESEYIALVLQRLDAAPSGNNEFIIDETVEYFQLRHLKIIAEEFTTAIENNDIMEARSVITDNTIPERDQDHGLDILDVDSIDSVMERSEADPLFKLPRALGQMLNRQMVPESLVAILAPEKRGKTFFLIEFYLAALRSGATVAFFSTGDMSESEIAERIYSRMTRKPITKWDCGEKLLPIADCIWNQKNTCTLPERACNVGVRESNQLTPYEDASAKYKACTACRKTNERAYMPAYWWKQRDFSKPMTREEIKTAVEKFRRTFKGVGRIKAFPSRTKKVSDIENQLNVWNKEGFTPSVIIIDYADIMAAEDRDARASENERWLGLRRLSQQRKACIITATQSDIQGHTAFWMNESNFSEDKRKLAHATAVFGLNQTPDERAKGIMRINDIVIRKGARGARCFVLECRAINNVHLDSFLQKGAL